jgi:WD40 repeat protein
LLAGVSILGFIHLWDARSGTWLRTLAGHTGAILDIDFSPDGKTLATAGDDYTVRLWDVASGQSTQLWEGHANAVTAVAFSPNGKTLASSSYDGTVKLWQVE